MKMEVVTDKDLSLFLLKLMNKIHKKYGSGSKVEYYIPGKKYSVGVAYRTEPVRSISQSIKLGFEEIVKSIPSSYNQVTVYSTNLPFQTEDGESLLGAFPVYRTKLEDFLIFSSPKIYDSHLLKGLKHSKRSDLGLDLKDKINSNFCKEMMKSFYCNYLMVSSQDGERFRYAYYDLYGNADGGTGAFQLGEPYKNNNCRCVAEWLGSILPILYNMIKPIGVVHVFNFEDFQSTQGIWVSKDSDMGWYELYVY